MKNLLKYTLASGLIAASISFVQAQTIVVGGKNFTEQQMLSSITTQLLQSKGFDVQDRSGMGSSAVRQAMENDQIDVYWEYTGTSLITYNKITERLGAKETYDKVKELDAQKGMTWLTPSEANNTYAFAMKRTKAAEEDISTLSDLADKVNTGNDLVFGSNAEFYARPDGLKPLMKAYDFEFSRSNIKRMDSGLVYQALKDGQVDVGLVFATDGRIPAFDFVVLKDDKEYFPAYAIVPVIRTEILEQHPVIGEELNKVSGLLTDDVMATLNARVDVERTSIETVAREFLQSNLLIPVM